MDKTKSIAEEKYKLLKVLDKTENVWKSKKSLTVAELVKSGKKAVKTGDTTPMDYWYTLIGLSLTVMLLFFIKYVMKKRD